MDRVDEKRTLRTGSSGDDCPIKYAVSNVRKKHVVEPQLYGDKGNNQYNWTMEGLNKLTVRTRN
jgi:hypothetical protein